MALSFKSLLGRRLDAREAQFRAELERDLHKEHELPELKGEITQASGAPKLPHGTWAFALHFVRHYWLALVCMFTLETGQAVCQILVPQAIRKIMDAVTAMGVAAAKPDMPMAEMWAVLNEPLKLFVGLSLGALAFSRISGASLVMLGPALRKRVRFNLYHYLQFHSQRYFIGNFAGSLANRISEVSMSVNHALWTVLFDFWPMTITFSVSLVMLFGVDAELGRLLAAWLAVYVGVSLALAARCRHYAQVSAAARSRVTGKIVDAVTNVLNTKMFARGEYERDYLMDYLDLEARTAKRTFWFMEKMRWFQWVSTLGLQGAMFFLGLQAWMHGRITAGTFAMVASLSILLLNEARNLSRRFLDFFEYVGNISDGVKIIVRPHEVLDGPGAPALQVSRGGISFDRVTFAYPEREAVFRELSVEIRAGERVGLVGFSGSGKTTFVNLLLRAYDVQGGSIRIDGQDIGKVTQDSLRAQVSMIPQEPLLFHRTLRENIRYGKLDATDAQVEEAARRAHAHEFIMAQPKRYDALVGERGIKLSGGQRQRVAIARAVLKDSPIVLMDEATSSLDSVTEKAIQLGLEELMTGRTVVVIAHRLSTIAHLDRILVFHEGRIIESGSHAQLLSQGGHYAKLWSMQAGGFLPEAETESESVAPSEEAPVQA